MVDSKVTFFLWRRQEDFVVRTVFFYNVWLRNFLTPLTLTETTVDEAMCAFPWTALVRRSCLFLLLVCDVIRAQDLKPTRWPLFSQKPVLLAWNAPTEDCGPRHGVHFKLSQFEIVASPNEGFVKQNLTIFYKERLGLYPYYESDREAFNGGIPQTASLTAHLEKMPEGVTRYIREPGAKGLAVIDWEEWRPLWIRNWDTKNIYREQSRHLVTEKNQDWSVDVVNRVAQQEFEMSAKKFMLETLRYAKSLRPNQLWGFYLFPDCYNHDYKSTLEDYTGRCPDVEMVRNDQLTWLWTESTALFPSIYLVPMLRSTASGRQFVQNRVMEAMRLASAGEGVARPVFVYTRPTYANELTLLTETDLVFTIGESVALGAAGVILWGDAAYASSKASCHSLNDYLQGPLGQYLLNVSTAAEQCSRALCAGRGRCLRRRPGDGAYLHLNPGSQRIVSEGPGVLRVSGRPSAEDAAQLRPLFHCQCYSGYQGEGCARPGPSPSTAAPGPRALLPGLLPLLLHTLLH
ncbi:hyaluronidase-2 isoform X1 [Conger conger]|uniref:hyaluronidase-2 isoform X1 n=1 Tax=Conger conger TaxID=82655 RepID=UPI002A5A82F6|nr:hyaluronidase-2 isoform X1 [Conger conger]